MYEKITSWKDWKLNDKLVYNDTIYELKRIFISIGIKHDCYEFEWLNTKTGNYKFVSSRLMNKSKKYENEK